MIAISLKAFAVWLLMVAAAIANGILRDNLLVNVLGREAALPVSGVLLAALVFLISYVTLPWLGKIAASSYIAVGLMWVALTLVFEFGFGHFVLGKSWQELLQVFKLAKGDLFLLVLLVSAASPYLVAKLRNLI